MCLLYVCVHGFELETNHMATQSTSGIVEQVCSSNMCFHRRSHQGIENVPFEQCFCSCECPIRLLASCHRMCVSAQYSPSVCMGYDTVVVPGKARYDICALWGILKNRHAPVSIWMDGQLLSADVTVLAVNHTQHMGRGLRGCPDARWDDGVLDIMYINRTTRAKLVRMFNGVKTGGKHVQLTPVVQGKEAVLRFPTEEGLFNIDGQVCRYEGGKISVQCKPNAIRFFSPK
eukprot:m.235474 g.235474  ORF g.235474 m.235474 type:complete len:231 (+) comp19339_c0_seq1:1555-2247(+)